MGNTFTQKQMVEIRAREASAMVQGYEQGFQCAIDNLRLVVNGVGDNHPLKQPIDDLVKMLENVLAKQIEKMPDNIQIVRYDGSRSVTWH